MKAKIFSLGMLKMFSIVASVTLGSLAAPGAVLIETVNVTPSSSGISSTITFNIPQFDPSLGTLNGVDLILTPTFGDFGSAAFNLSSSPQQVVGFTVGAPMSGSLRGALGLNASWTTSQNLTSPNYTASAGPGVITDGPALPFTFVTTLSSVVVGPGGFTGLGGYNLVLNGSGVATSSGSGPNLACGWYGNVGGTLEVDFNYAAAPEPSTYFAGLSALGMLGLFGWRNRK